MEFIVKHAISEFILSHLIIAEFKREECRFEVNLQFRQSDSNSHINELICAAVADLQPYETETKNSKLLARGAVQATLAALEEDKRSLLANRQQAAVLEAEVRAQLSGKQRWRIPIVLIKMDKGKVLSAGDNTIWEHVSHSLKTQADIERVAEITLQTATTEAQLAAKKALKGVKSPARPVVSRANSSRLLAGTATSQTRTQYVEEDNSVVPSLLRANSKQNIKRSSSNRALHGKGLHRMKSRLSASRENSASFLDTSADQEPEHPDALDNSESLNPISENLRAGFASQVAASLTSFVNSISTKLKPSTMSLKLGAVSSETAISPQTSFYVVPVPQMDQELDGVPAELPFLHRQLADLVSYIASGKFLSPSLKANGLNTPVNVSSDEFVGTVLASVEHQVLTGSTSQRGKNNETPNAGSGSTLPIISVKVRTTPGKRRSFTETLLAMLVREDSMQASASGNALSTLFFTNLQPVRKDTFDTSGELLLQDLPRSSKPSGVSSWLPWRREPSSSAKVVPDNLAEYTRAQFAD
eukprot:gene15304-17512_t